MSLAIDCVLIDCNDLERMSAVWSSALNLEYVWTVLRVAACWLTNRRRHDLDSCPCTQEKRGKNRVHSTCVRTNPRFDVWRGSGPDGLTLVSGMSRGSSWQSYRSWIAEGLASE